MTTNTAQVSPPVRQDPRQVVNSLKKTITAGDAGLATGIAMANSIPQGAQVIDVMVDIETAFDAGTLTVGTNSSSFNDLVAGGDVDNTVIATTKVNRGIGGSIPRSAAKTPYVMNTGSPTVGKAHVTIVYEGGWDS